MKVKYKYKPKYPGGGVLPIVNAASTVSSAGGNIIKNQNVQSNGSIGNVNNYALGQGLGEAGKYAALGAQVGSFAGPIGTLVGAGVGALGGGAYGFFNGKKEANSINSGIREQELLQEQQLAQQAAQEAEFKKMQQDNWNKSIYAANPQLANPTGSLYANGGNLPIASDTTKVNGPTHAGGGVPIFANNTQIAEVEGGEVIKGSRVYSDRLKVDGKHTYAEVAEKLGRKKGKYEKLATSTNYREKNTFERGIANVENSLNTLFQHQEASKIPVNNTGKFPYGGDFDENGNIIFTPSSKTLGQRSLEVGAINKMSDPTLSDPTFTPSSKSNDERYQEYLQKNKNSNTFNYSQIANGLQTLVPFIDNAYNAHLINKTPQIVKPNQRVYNNAVAMPMKTTFNVDNQLAQINSDYRGAVNNLDNNVSSANVARANKAAMFANTLNAKNNIYANKENIETQLVNANNQNIQNVQNQNLLNKQNIDNQNLALLDGYNTANTMRSDNILRNKASNVANAVGDAQRLIEDKNMAALDNERIMLDSLKYYDGAGFAKLVGTPSMDSLINSNAFYYKQIETSLKSSGQTAALNKFYGKYGRK